MKKRPDHDLQKQLKNFKTTTKSPKKEKYPDHKKKHQTSSRKK
uniref:Uncharacterized protein n=1 Tax=Rhizophora mucronata TaxID=61149 RepID=A0A2P2N2G0_RHIMU